MAQKYGKVFPPVLAVLLCSSLAWAHARTSLNGTWTLVPTQTEYQGQPVVQTGTVTIAVRESNIYVARDFQYAGDNREVSYRFSTDGPENATIHRGRVFQSKARWNGDVLHVSTTQDDGSQVLERYSLAPDGKMMLVLERSGHAPVTLVFQRR
jgi:hypothetical protein